MKFLSLLDVLHERMETSSAEEIKRACELIIEVQAMSSAEIDCIKASYKLGPLFDGDIPSKSGRDSLLKSGFMSKVVVNGQDGFNACTHKGAWAYRLIIAEESSTPTSISPVGSPCRTTKIA